MKITVEEAAAAWKTRKNVGTDHSTAQKFHRLFSVDHL
jgi:hypothetical protein